jgi:hypothetical protein
MVMSMSIFKRLKTELLRVNRGVRCVPPNTLPTITKDSVLREEPPACTGFESIGHLTAKQCLYFRLIAENERSMVWLNYPFFNSPDFPDTEMYDEHCPKACDQQLSSVCRYRHADGECACLRCASLNPRFIADIAIAYKGRLIELWEFTHNNHLPAEKLAFYQLLSYRENVAFYAVPSKRVLAEIIDKVPDLDTLRRDYRG